ncbi:MAG: L,D-transpeptidase [Solirubrobacterales bacterium]
MFFASIPLAQADTVDLTLAGVRNQVADAGSTVTVNGTVAPAGPGVPVTVKATIGDETIFTRSVLTKTNGEFSLPVYVERCCQYNITASTATAARTIAFNVGLPKKLKKGSHGPEVALLHSALRDQGYFVRGKKRFTDSTGLALLAFRKVNKMHRNTRYGKGIFRRLLEGRGAFPLAHPDDGKHVEADLSRQVLVLAEGGEPKYTFPISSGAPATPTVTGKYSFYLKTPGYNAKGMYFSSYFIRGYATHGYSPVPNYPASHGCLRNPIPDSRFIYNWIDIGDTIYVYH